eukprot:CAMPEP_0171917858 /NCGR_PEP_ID=MMETSP0993-20121228/16474_1 /TAXON_ID=483369 /ORGANISM="non described non described, Strain CCMP2098" /LENGTH=150 /DNA_ID=CAMNT_0012553921 /DNA_START=183 /DNA_END=635 /DNA_ORIENTATION=+
MVYIGPVPLVGRERGDESGRKGVGEKDRGREEKKEEGREWKKGKGRSGRKRREGGEGVEGMKRRRDEKKEGEGRRKEGRKEGWGKRRRRRREEEEGEKNGTKNPSVGGTRAGKSSMFCGSSSHCPQCGEIVFALDMILKSAKGIIWCRLL